MRCTVCDRIQITTEKSNIKESRLEDILLVLWIHRVHFLVDLPRLWRG